MKKFLIPLAFAVTGAVAIAAAVHQRNKLPPGATLAEIEFALPPSFLDPGPPPKGPVDEPVEVGKAPAGKEGIVPIRLWHATSLVRYQRDAQGHLTKIGIVPISRDPQSDGWNIWRHRHAYVYLPGRGYFWSTLGDERLPMPDEQGKLYDAFLKAVWSYWTVVGLEARRLKGATDDDEPSTALFRRAVRVAMLNGKLARPASVDIQINPWRLPVRIQMDIRSSTSTDLLEMADGFHWKYDMDGWRRRHGYRKTLFLGYEWLDGFNAPFPMNDAVGRELDNLLERTLSFWAEAVASEVITELDLKVAATAAPAN